MRHLQTCLPTTRHAELVRLWQGKGYGLCHFWRSGVLGLTLLAMAATSHSSAQTIPMMGFVAAKNADPKRLEVFRRGLGELGYIEGKNLRIEYREAVLDGDYDGVMADLVSRKVDMIIAECRRHGCGRQSNQHYPNRDAGRVRSDRDRRG
jgi:hypothetical protein